VFPVLLPMAARLDVLAGMDFGGAAKHGDEIALAAHLDAQQAKAGFATMAVTRSTSPDKGSRSFISGADLPMLHFPCLAGAPLIRTTRAGIIIQPEPALHLSQDADVNACARDRPKASDQLNCVLAAE
jgi:hypothetical protein